ncbi:MAG TPA: hypothetical protein VF678_12215 [bacterium]
MKRTISRLLLACVLALAVSACSTAATHHPYLAESPRNPLHFEQR